MMDKGKMKREEEQIEHVAGPVLEECNRLYRVLSDMVVAAEGATDEEIPSILCRDLCRICNAAWAALFSYNADTETMVFEAFDGDNEFKPPADFLGTEVSLPREEAKELALPRIEECKKSNRCLVGLLPERLACALTAGEQTRCYRLSYAPDGQLMAAGVVVLRPGEDLKMKDMVKACINIAGTILQRVKAARSLRASEERYKAVVEDQAELICRFRPDGALTFVNEAYCRFFSKARKDLIGTDFLASLGDEVCRKDMKGKLALLSREEPVCTVEDRLVMPDGGWRWQQWTARAVFDPSGCIAEIQSVGQDITEKKLAEEEVLEVHEQLEQRVRERTEEIRDANRQLQEEITERRRAEEALRQSKERFRTLFESSPDAIFVESPEGIVLDVNPAACRLHGQTREELIGTNVLDLVPREARDSVAKEYGKWLTGELNRYEGFSLTSSGRNVPVEIRASQMTYLGETALVLHVRDLTERRRAETALRKSEEQLQQAQKMEALGRLAGGIAHDFNNLLTSILGYGKLVEEELTSGDPLRNDIEEVLRAAERAADLTGRLLAFGRKQIVEMRAVNVNTIVADTDKLLRRTLGEDIELVTLLGDDLGAVEVDPGQLAHVVMNLAINARDAMPKGGTLTIETRRLDLSEQDAWSHPEARAGEYVVVSVRDTGCGMEQDVREHAFEPFFTTKEDGQGTGLGLSTVYGIIQQFHGHIELKTERGSGSEFLMYFPRLNVLPEKVGVAKEEHPLPRGTECVLVCEDEGTVRRLAVRILKSLGYEVLEAGNGGEALMECEKRKEPIDLVLTDMVMPKISGRELVERLRTIRSDFKVLYMTGFTQDAVFRPGGKVTRTPVLLKPFTREELAVKVRLALDTE